MVQVWISSYILHSRLNRKTKRHPITDASRMKTKKPEYPPNAVSRRRRCPSRGAPVGDAGFPFEECRCTLRRKQKSRRRPTLARASPALPSAKEPLTSVFGMGTGVTTPLWPPAKSRKLDAKENRNISSANRISHLSEVLKK